MQKWSSCSGSCFVWHRNSSKKVRVWTNCSEYPFVSRGREWQFTNIINTQVWNGCWYRQICISPWGWLSKLNLMQWWKRESNFSRVWTCYASRNHDIWRSVWRRVHDAFLMRNHGMLAADDVVVSHLMVQICKDVKVTPLIHRNRRWDHLWFWCVWR